MLNSCPASACCFFVFFFFHTHSIVVISITSSNFSSSSYADSQTHTLSFSPTQSHLNLPSLVVATNKYLSSLLIKQQQERESTQEIDDRRTLLFFTPHTQGFASSGSASLQKMGRGCLCVCTFQGGVPVCVCVSECCDLRAVFLCCSRSIHL